jgi:flagellar basal-body rod protein FlgG
MLRGLYTAAAGMITQERKHDAVTNNIANLNTPGFKRSESVARSFPEMLISRVRGGDGRGSETIGRLSTGVFAEENIPVFLQGDLQETGQTFDFALVSEIQVEGALFDSSGKYVAPDGQVIFRPQAFFTVLNGNGEVRYTRNGKFTVNAAGELVTPDGYRVLGDDGQPIVLRDPATDAPVGNVKLDATGFLMTEDGQPLAGFLLTRVENPNRLIPEGNGVFRLNPDDAALAVPVAVSDEVQIRQGFVERSNVDAAQSMVDLMTALRAYEANQKIVQYYDRSLEKTVNEVGRV